MTRLGYALSSEELSPSELIKYAQHAEASGFPFSLISDHFHPWISDQNHSPFVWSVLGGLAQATKKMMFGTGVTCPTFRIHPLIVAQAAATHRYDARAIFPGVGTGEYLNEHITGANWPRPAMRLQMLEEAVRIIRLMWHEGSHGFEGNYYTVRDARIFTLPKNPPAIIIAASKPLVADLAGRIGDGLVSTVPDKNLIQEFEAAGGRGKPRYGQITVCYAESEEAPAATVRKQWPNAGIGSPLTVDLPTPGHSKR